MINLIIFGKENEFSFNLFLYKKELMSLHYSVFVKILFVLDNNFLSWVKHRMPEHCEISIINKGFLILVYFLPTLMSRKEVAWFFFLLFGLWGYWHCGHSWPIVPASGDNEDDYGEADGM
jgi:hypothetical protein